MTSRCSDISCAGRNRGCKPQGSLYRLSHDGRIGFSIKLKLSGWSGYIDSTRRPKLVGLCCQLVSRASRIFLYFRWEERGNKEKYGWLARLVASLTHWQGE